MPAPEVAHRVAVLVVPLGPEDREVADLVAAGADVPGLGDQLHLREDRVLVDDVEEGREPVDVVQLTRERRGEVEAEPVHVAVDDPVAQRVRDQAQDARVHGVERVARAREVHVPARVVVREPVVRGVVDALEREHRAEVVPLRGVVVDDVEEHLDARAVERLDEPLELTHLLAPGARRRVRRVGREVPDRGVAPVVPEAALVQEVLVGDVVDRHQLDRRHAERCEMADGGVRGEPGERPPKLVGDARAAHREPLHVQLVDDRVRPRRLQERIALPVELRVDDHALRDRVGVVLVVPLEIGVGAARGHVRQRARSARVHLPVDRLRVRVDEELRRVEAVALLRRPRPVHPIAVPLTGPDPGDVAVPVVRRPLGQLDAGLAALVVEQAELDPLRVLREEGEVRSAPVPRRPQRKGPTRPRAGHPASGTSHTTPSAGSVTSPEYGWSCHGVASAATRPRLPTPEPPYSTASVFSTSRQPPGSGRATR